MKTIYLILLLVFSFTFIKAQDNQDSEYIVAILPTTANSPQSAAYKGALDGWVTKTFTGKGRFLVVDRSSFNKIAEERNLQKQEDFIDGYMVEQGRSLGAQYLISAAITQFSASSRNGYTGIGDNRKAVVFQDVMMSVTLQVIDVTTSQIMNSEVLTDNKSEHSTSEQAVVSSILNGFERDLKKWTNKIFMPTMKIVKIESFDKKGMPETVLITGADQIYGKGGIDLGGGVSIGIGIATPLEIYIDEVEVLDGKKYRREIVLGKVLFKKAEGDLTECKVTKGEDKIMEKMNEKRTLYARLAKE